MLFTKQTLGLTAFIFSFFTFIMTGCQPSKNTNAANTSSIDLEKLILLKDTLSGSYRLSLFAQDSLHDQNETLYILLRDSAGKALENIPVDYSLRMDMGMMSHGGPYYPIVDLGHGLFKAEVVFIMPNMQDMGKGWLFQGLINKKDSINILLPVNQAASMRTTAVETQEDGRIFVSLIAPQKASTGIQKINFTLHKIGQHDFPTLDGYTLTVEPFMPDMGHGSSNNEPAQSQGDGRYQGTMNLSMPGLWQIKVKVFKKGIQAVHEELIFKLHAVANE